MVGTPCLSVLVKPDWPRLVVSARRSQGVIPNGRLEGLLIRSKLAPGIGEIYNFGAAHIPEFPTEPDDATANQIERVYGFPYNFRKTETLLPNVSLPSVPDNIAAEYEVQLRQCQDEHQCTSEYVKMGTAFLTERFSDTATRAALEGIQAAAKLPVEKEPAKVLVVLFAKS